LPWALDYLQLGTIFWPAVLAEGLSIPITPETVTPKSDDAIDAAEQIVGPERVYEAGVGVKKNFE
jgi:hypothetical protein